MFQDLLDIFDRKALEFRNVLIQGNIDSMESLKYHRGVLFGLELASQALKDYQKEIENDKD